MTKKTGWQEKPSKKKETDKKSQRNARDILKSLAMILLLCVWAFVSVIGVQFVVGILMIKILGAERFNRPVWTACFAAISYIIAMLLVIIVPILLKKKMQKRNIRNDKVKKKLDATETRMELGLMGLPTWTDIGLAPVSFIVSLLLASMLVSTFSAFPWFNAEQAQNVGFSIYMSGGDRVIAFLTLVVLAPIAEEIIFRGWLYGKMRNQLLGKVSETWGIVISTFAVSLVFGIVHLQWNVGVTVFALSVILCALREVTGTIYAGILTHMLKNGVAFFLLYVFGIV